MKVQKRKINILIYLTEVSWDALWHDPKTIVCMRQVRQHSCEQSHYQGDHHGKHGSESLSKDGLEDQEEDCVEDAHIQGVARTDHGWGQGLRQGQAGEWWQSAERDTWTSGTMIGQVQFQS